MPEVNEVRFTIGDDPHVYSLGALEDVSLRDLLLWEAEASALGLSVCHWSDLERIAEEVQTLPEAEQGRHPDGLVLMATSIWAARREAGQDVSFTESLDLKLKDLHYLPAPKAPSDREGKGKGKGKDKPPPVSVRATDDALS